MKKKVIIIVVTIIIIGIAVYFYLKSKKKATAITSSVSSVNNSVASSVADSVKSIVPTSTPVVASPVVTSPVVTSPVVNSPVPQTPFSSSNTPAPIGNSSVEYNFVDVILDKSKGKAIIQFQPVTRNFVPGESVRILTGPYAGVHKIWYIYQGVQSGAPVHNLYLDTDYKTAGLKVPGKFYKA